MNCGICTTRPSTMWTGPSKLVCFLVLFPMLLACYGFVRFEPTEEVNVVNEDGKQVLILPEQFGQAIETNFPDFSLPTEADMTGLWASRRGFPFITYGDFNGDGLQDNMVLLINDQAWRAPIFHKTSQGYEVALDRFGNVFGPQTGRSGPQEMFLYIVHKGEVITQTAYSEVDDVEVTTQIGFEFEGIYFSIEESADIYIFWKDGQYEKRSFAE